MEAQSATPIDSNPRKMSGKLCIGQTLSDDQIRKYRMALAGAVGDELLDRTPSRHDYHAVRTPRCRPSKALQRILDGRHRQSPDHGWNRQRHIAEQQAKSGTEKKGGFDR